MGNHKAEKVPSKQAMGLILLSRRGKSLGRVKKKTIMPTFRTTIWYKKEIKNIYKIIWLGKET
jgi:hypothetical protein